MLGSAPVPSAELNLLITERNFNSLANTLRANPYQIVDTALIQKALVSKDMALILTLYFHSKFAQAIIQHIALKPDAVELQRKLSNYKILFQNLSITTNVAWEHTLYQHLNKWDDLRSDTSLHAAIRQNDGDKISALIQQGADFYAKNQRGISPVHLAAALPNTRVLQQMAEYVEAKDKATRSWLNRIRLGWGLDVSCLDDDGESPIHVAAQNPQPEILQWIFTSARWTFSDRNVADKQGFTPLHHAVLADQSENVKTLLAIGADQTRCAKKHILEHTVKDPQSFHQPLTPLWLALEKRNFNVIPLLMSTRSDLFEVTNSSGMTAVHLAASLGKTDQLLLWKNQVGLKNYRVLLLDYQKRTPLHYAALADELESFKVLSSVYPIYSEDKEGNQPLHYASMHPNAQVTKYILDEYQKEQAGIQNSSWLLKSAKEKFATVNINARNHRGITPYILASQLNNTVAVQLLEGSGCDKSTLSERLYQTISKPEFRQGEATEQESFVAKFAAPISDLIKSNNTAVINAIHLCAMYLNYRMALILLHPLSLAERKQLCSAQNDAGKTPFMLLKEAYEQAPEESKPSLKEFYEKFRRLLMRYDINAYQNEIATSTDIIQFHFQITQDKRAELMASKGYSYASSAMLYGLPTWAFFSTWATTGFAFCGLEAACSVHFGVDFYDKAERGLQHLRPYLHNRLQAPLSWTQNALWGLGWYRNTGMRLGVEAVRQGGAYVLSHLDPADYGLASPNYFTHTNMTGALYYTVEEVGGRWVLAPYVKEYIPSLESVLNTHLGVPTVNELTDLAGEALNNKFEEVFGINLKQTIANGYYYFRKEIAGVKPSEAQLSVYFDEHIAAEIKKEIKETDPSTCELLLDGAKVIFKLYYDAQDELEANMSDWLNIANAGFTGDNNYELFDLVVSDLAAKGADYTELAAKILFQPHLVKNYGFSADVVQQKYLELTNYINANRDPNTPSQTETLSNAATAIYDSLNMTYLQTRKWGQEAANDYINTLVSIFGHDKFKTPSGRAEYLSWEVINTNPLIFGDMSAEERKTYAKDIQKRIENAQTGSSKHHEQQAVDCYNAINVFYSSMVLNQSYSNGIALNLTTHSILNQYDAIEARAAFAVHQIQSYLSQTEGYGTLSIKDQIKLYFAMIDAHYLGSLTKTEEAIHNLAWGALQSHAIDKSNYALLAGQYSLDEAANRIFVTSRDAAEGRWAGSTEDQTRIVPVVQHSTFKQILNFVKENSSGSAGVGAQTNGNKAPVIGTYNFNNGQVTPFKEIFGLPSVGKFSFELPAKVSSGTVNPSAYDMHSLLFTMTNANQPISPLDALWNETIDRAMAEIVHLPTEQDYFETFTQTIQKHQQDSLAQSYSNIVDSTSQNTAGNLSDLRNKVSQAIDVVTESAARIANVAAENPPTLVCEKPDIKPSLLDQLNPIRDANAFGPLACAPVLAPIVLEELALGAAALAAIFMPKRDDSKLEFPSHQEENDGVYPGEPADPSLTGPTILTTPIGEQQGLSKLETLIDQPKPDSSPLGFPIHKHPVPFLYNYVRNSLNSSSSNEVRLFRAVKLAEYEQIMRTHDFQGIGNGIKYFTRSLEEAKLYASKEPHEKYVIVSTLYKGEIQGDRLASVDGGIRAVILKDHELPKLSSPVIVDQGYLFKDIISQANGNVMKLPGTYSGLSYDHSIQDHSNMKNPYGGSLIYDQQTGQRLIDTAYINPIKPEQLFNYYNDSIIRFELSNDGAWKADVVKNNIEKTVGTDVLRAFKDHKLISNAEYKTFLKM